MKTPSPSAVGLILVLAAATWAGPVRATEVSDVQTPTKRQELLDQAKKLLAPREAVPPAFDPFHSEAFNDLIAASHGGGTTTGGEIAGTHAAPAPGPRSPHGLLQAIATGLKPSGFFVLGGEPTLVFGQKRVKAGGFVTITFEGTEYTLEVISINLPNFTIRLNREEFTRPIK